MLRPNEILVVEAARRLGTSRRRVLYLVAAGRIRVTRRQGATLWLDAADVQRESGRRRRIRDRIRPMLRL